MTKDILMQSNFDTPVTLRKCADATHGHVYIVDYGQDRKVRRYLKDALEDFTNSTRHSAQCAGLFDI